MACIDDEDVAHLLRWVQDGVVSRRQLLELGLADHDIRREVRRRRLTQVHRGVLVNHSGPLSWEQRAWAAVLVHAPAALTLDSALPGPRRAERPIHVAIDLHRTVPRVRGVVAHRTARWSERVAVGASPPRLRLEEAAVEVAVRARDPWVALQCFASVCHTRRTGAEQIAAALRLRGGVPDRALLLELTADLAAGTCSVLEREYLLRVEQAHGLPTGHHQRREQTRGGVVYRDVMYEPWRLVVELDGHAFHSSPRARDRDLDRDLDAAADGDLTTLRLGWGQVLDRSCRTAALIARVLRRQGWTGRPTRCPRCPRPDPDPSL